jgi:hypothetical protein
MSNNMTASPVLTFTAEELEFIRPPVLKPFDVVDGIELYRDIQLLDALYGEKRWITGRPTPSRQAVHATERINAEIEAYRKTLKPGDFISSYMAEVVEEELQKDAWAHHNDAIRFCYGSEDRPVAVIRAVRAAKADGKTRVMLEDMS